MSFGRRNKKKKLALDEPKAKSHAFTSIFNQEQFPIRDEKPQWESSSFRSEAENELEIGIKSGWDIAVRYHEFKSQLSSMRQKAELRRVSAQAILDQAQNLLGSIVHPMDFQESSLSEMPVDAQGPDLDLEATMESAPLEVAAAVGQISGNFPISESQIQMTYSLHRRQALVLSVDTSLSMTGEKLALTAVALAVVLLQFPDDPIGIVAFENQAKIIKQPNEKLSIRVLLERFLDVPAQGYTHLEDGLKVSLEVVRSPSFKRFGIMRPPSTVLLTDGKYTAGKDPAYLAPRFPHLVVLKMGAERTSLELCRELAKHGRGILEEVKELDSLPRTMYGVVKDLLRK